MTGHPEKSLTAREHVSAARHSRGKRAPWSLFKRKWAYLSHSAAAGTPGNRSMKVLLDTYSHVLMDQREIDYASVIPSGSGTRQLSRASRHSLRGRTAKTSSEVGSRPSTSRIA